MSMAGDMRYPDDSYADFTFVVIVFIIGETEPLLSMDTFNWAVLPVQSTGTSLNVDMAP
jgi:hypothetical protein